MPIIPAAQDPNLIKVFQPSNPDQPLYADQRQINAEPAALIKWSQREQWLASRKPAAKPKAAAAQPEPEAPAPAAPKAAGRTKAELLAEAAARGIAVTKRMTVAQLEAALAA